MIFTLNDSKQEQELREWFYDNSIKTYNINTSDIYNFKYLEFIDLNISLFVPGGLFKLYVLDNLNNPYPINKGILGPSRELLIGDITHTVLFNIFINKTEGNKDILNKIKYFKIIIKKIENKEY